MVHQPFLKENSELDVVGLPTPGQPGRVADERKQRTACAGVSIPVSRWLYWGRIAGDGLTVRNSDDFRQVRQADV